MDLKLFMYFMMFYPSTPHLYILKVHVHVKKISRQNYLKIKFSFISFNFCLGSPVWKPRDGPSQSQSRETLHSACKRK